MNLWAFQRQHWLAGLSLAGFAVGFAPALRAQEVNWFRLDGVPQVSTGVDAEVSTEQNKIAGGTSTYDHTSISPLVGLHTTGSIYHPNLLAFDLGGELGWGWDNTSGSGQVTRNESAELLRYLAEFDLLRAKPGNASFFAEQDHAFRDYGTFNTYTVDATRYGGRVNWTDDAFTLNADLGYRNEKASGITDSSELSETYLNFLGTHKRKTGQTSLTIHANELENAFNYGNTYDTKNWSAGLSDSETFGQRHQISTGAGVSFSQSEFSGQQINTFNASGNVNVNHRRNLDSYLTMSLGQHELRQLTSTRVQGTAGIRHQLYESLTSDLEAHITHQEDTGTGDHSTFDRYGVGLSENYTKHMQSWARLTVGTGLNLDHQEQSSPVGTQTWFDENHQIYQSSSPSYQKIFLFHPRVSNVLEVKAGSYTLPASDYQLVPSGELTEVQLVATPSFPTASLMTNGALAVTITYQSQSLGSSAYDTFGASAQFRLDLWNQVGLYARINWLDNNAPADVVAQTMTDLVGGVDYRRKWFGAGAELESYDSNFTQYQSLRFFQTFDFALSRSSSLGFDCSETFYHYPDHGDQSQYQFTGRYDTQLPLSLTWHLEGGLLVQEIDSTEQIQGIARTSIGWARGKLTLRAGYEFNAQSTSSSSSFTEERVKHRFFTYLRRSF